MPSVKRHRSAAPNRPFSLIATLTTVEITFDAAFVLCLWQVCIYCFLRLRGFLCLVLGFFMYMFSFGTKLSFSPPAKGGKRRAVHETCTPFDPELPRDWGARHGGVPERGLPQ